MNIFLTTVSSNQTIRDLGGIKLTHPQTLDILTRVPLAEVLKSTDLKTLITTNALIAKDEHNNTILATDLIGEVRYQKTKPFGYAQLDSNGQLPSVVIPGGNPNEKNAILNINDYPVFNVGEAYQPNTLKVYLQGQRLERVTDYTENDPTTGEFTLIIPVDTILETSLVVDYRTP